MLRSEPALRALLGDGPIGVSIAGESMHPRLARGQSLDLVSRPRLPLPGDVLVFRDADGSLVAHRLLGLFPGRELRAAFQGDAAPRPDALVPWRLVVGALNVPVSGSERLKAALRGLRLTFGALARRLS